MALVVQDLQVKKEKIYFHVPCWMQILFAMTIMCKVKVVVDQPHHAVMHHFKA